MNHTMNIQNQLLVIKPSQFLNIGFVIIFLGSLFTGSPFLIVPLLFVLGWKVLDLYCISWSLSHDSIIETSGVLNVTTDEVHYFRIKDVHLYQPLLYRLVGLSRLTITTSDKSKPIIVLNGIYDGKRRMQTLNHSQSQLVKKWVSKNLTLDKIIRIL